MKAGMRILLIVALTIAALLASAAALQAHASFTTFTGTEFCPLPDFSSARVTFPDGRMHVRDAVLACVETTSDPRLGGINHGTMNGNFASPPPNLTGPIWGTWQMGNWSGTWEGYWHADGVTYRAVGQGSGPYEGLQVMLETDRGTITGRILETHGE